MTMSAIWKVYTTCKPRWVCSVPVTYPLYHGIYLLYAKHVCSFTWYILGIYYQSTVYTPCIYQHMLIYVAQCLWSCTWPAWPSSIHQTYVLYKPTVPSHNNDWTVASKAYAWRLLGMMPALSKSATVSQTDEWRTDRRTLLYISCICILSNRNHHASLSN